jgi:L-lactate dehydrogenase complex protein LldE
LARIQLFHTCLVNEIDPDVGMAVVRVLERAGVEVDVPRDQTCCGQPPYNAGFHDEARTIARHTLRVLDATEGPIVIPSGSCADMLVHQYAELFANEPETLAIARRVSARCREFSQYLIEVAPSGVGGHLQAVVAFHPSCHLLRGLGVRDQPPALLNAVNGVEQAAVHESEECCGFGGLFSVKNSGISTGIPRAEAGQHRSERRAARRQLRPWLPTPHRRRAAPPRLADSRPASRTNPR